MSTYLNLNEEKNSDLNSKSLTMSTTVDYLGDETKRMRDVEKSNEQINHSITAQSLCHRREFMTQKITISENQNSHRKFSDAVFIEPYIRADTCKKELRIH